MPVLTENSLLIACPTMIHRYGVPYYIEGWHQLQEFYSDLRIELAIPCGDNRGMALQALELGVRVLYVTRASTAWDQLVLLSQEYGAVVIPQEDLDDRLD